MRAPEASTTMKMAPEKMEPDTDAHALCEIVLAALKGIRYGSLEIIIHDSHVVQIERKEKIRFDRESRSRV